MFSQINLKIPTAISEAIRREIEEKAKLYEAAKEKIKARIESNISIAVGRLETIESELLKEVDEEFGKNPFTEFLGNNNSRTDADAKRLLAEQKIPENLGPGEKSFSSLLKKIDSLRAWGNFVPENLKMKSATCDSITLTWDKVIGASFYQIKVDGSITWDTTTTNEFTKKGLISEAKYSFRVRTVKGSLASEWSDAVKGRTLKETFKTSIWKECPDGVDADKKYSVNLDNPKVATKVTNGYCTIIGNTPIPLNTVKSWNIKVLKSRDNNGGGICIGVAPSDINQNEKINTKCGWYLYCYRLALCSGPPHNYVDKEYMPRGKYGQYVHTGDSVGVVMDTIKGDLSFIVNGVKHGVMYGGVPLDKPLVPCVLLRYEGDSVELDLSETKTN